MVKYLILLLWCITARCEAGELSVEDLIRKAPKEGLFEIVGYVVSKYQCPPCPPQDQCKPCMKEHVVVSSSPEMLRSYPPRSDCVIVFTYEVESIKVGTRYKMQVRVLDHRGTGTLTNDLALQNYTEIDQK